MSKRMWWLFGVPVGLMALVAAGFIGWSVVASQPEPVGARVPPAGLAPRVLDAHAGLYRGDSGQGLLVAPSAAGGFALFSTRDFVFDGSRDIGRLHREGRKWTLRRADGSRVPARLFEDPSTGAPTLLLGGAGSAVRWTRDPAAPYLVRAVEFGDAPGLSGTLFLPRTEAPAPGAVLIHGSGDSDRDGLWYVLVARALAEQGVAVLLPDKRGSGRSQGEWRTASFAQLAQDALAGAAVLSRQPGVDPDRVGLVGLSQGGWIAPLAADASARVAFSASLAAAAVTPRMQTRHELGQELRGSGVPGWLAPALLPVVARMPERRLPGWWKANGDFDPVPVWQRLRQPVLIVLGARDEHDNVPVAESLARLQRLRQVAPRLRVEVLQDSGHGLLHPGTQELHPRLRTLLPAWIRSVPPRKTPARTAQAASVDVAAAAARTAD